MDIDYLLWLQGVRQSLGSGAESLLCLITTLGMPQYLLIVVATVYYCIDRRVGARILASFCLGSFVNEFLKILFCVYRPFVRDTRLHVADAAASGAIGYSFPSGHAALAAGTFGSLARSYRKRRPVVVACVVAVVLIVFSRNYLGCHTPQDVVVGVAVGYGAACVVDRVFGWVGACEGRDVRILLCCLAASVAALAIAMLKPYPIDYDAAGNVLYDPMQAIPVVFYAAGAFDAMALGLVLERRLVGFEDTSSWTRRLLRLVPGVVLMFLLLALGMKLGAVVGTLAGYFAIGFLPVFAIAFLWPLAFVHIEKALPGRKG